MHSLNLSQFFVWLAFLFTTVYGHVAMKFAATGSPKLTKMIFTPWAVSAMLAWTASGLLWMHILSKQSLIQANSVASLRYVLIAFSAFLFLSEPLSPLQIFGAVLIAVGVYFSI